MIGRLNIGSFRSRIVLAFTVLTAVFLASVVIVDLVGVPFTADRGRFAAHRESTLSELELTSGMLSERLSSWVKERRQDGIRLSMSPFLRKSVERQTTDSTAELEEELAASLKIHSGFNRITILDPNTGAVRIAVRDGARERHGPHSDFPVEKLVKLVLPGYRESIAIVRDPRDEQPHLRIIRQLLASDSSGKIIGLLVAESPLDAALRQLIWFVRGTIAAHEWNCALGVALGGVTAQFQLDTKGVSYTDAPVPERSGGVPLRLAMAGIDGPYDGPDPQGRPVLAFHRQIKLEGSNSLGLVVAVSRAVADRPAAQDLARHVGLWLGMLLAGFAISAMLARQLSRPVHALVVAAHRVQVGDLTARIVNADADSSEIGQLGNVFNKMVERLQQWNQHLEQQVAERTQELRSLSARLDAILKAVPDVVMEVDRNHVFTWANSAGFAFFGPDVIGREAASYFEGDQRADEVFRPLHERTSSLIDVESLQRRQDGAIRLLAWRCRTISDEQMGVTGLLSIARDITDIRQAEAQANAEREKLQAQLAQAQKMEAVGRLAGGVAHDFNNMLVVIIGHAEMTLAKMDPDHPFHAHLTEIAKAGERSADLTRQLLAFARKQTVAPKVLSLNETVADMIQMLQRLIGEEIEIVWAPGENVWPVKIDPGQIDQILANLCVNARDAITGVGKVTIETGNAAFDGDYCRRHAGVVPGEYALLGVRDSGCGMDAETVSQIFEPFFTTKEMGKGTGLGLATVYGIVNQNGGFINVRSKPGQGTSFELYLPRHTGQEEGRVLALSQSSAPTGHETVLVVEDEPMILDMITAMLKQLGYTVLAASKPNKALELAGAHEGELHLLLTDVVMPELNGKELAKQLSVFYPDMRTLFMSGYTADIIARRGVLDEGVSFLPKPFTASALAAKVREALGKR